MKNIIPVIGLEVHIELSTKRKMFCDCSAAHFAVDANTNICPVCMGLPGALPYANIEAINRTLILGMAYNCKILKLSKFDRKHYFYPDLPKAYQISQYDMPFCKNGRWTIGDRGNVGIRRIHLEEDTGKLIHKIVNGRKSTLIDFNRSGVPLLELVTEPDFRDVDQVILFLKDVQKNVRFLSISNADMEKGSMRIEANISVSELTSEDLTKLVIPNYKVELKNINSFKFAKKALEAEIGRQTNLLRKKVKIIQETRGYDSIKNVTFSQRSKEEAHDYRYFPEPDIPPFEFTENYLKDIKKRLYLLPSKYENIFINQYRIKPEYARIFTETREGAENILGLFEQLVKQKIDVKKCSDIIVNRKLDVIKLDIGVIKNIINTRKQTLFDKKELFKLIKLVISENENVVKDYNKGKHQAIMVLVGKLMKKTGGRADPLMLRKLLEKKLNGN